MVLRGLTNEEEEEEGVENKKLEFASTSKSFLGVGDIVAPFSSSLQNRIIDGKSLVNVATQ